MWVTVGLFGFYLIKPLFSFRSNKEHKTEVFRNECPELFAAIDDVGEKTGAKKPKHVYLSPGTNACVFFNRSFWSIFFPVRKNLEIGLGLFNSTSIVELKAIMAHEFGHFSQRSMRIVSSIYITNSIIAEMIDNDAWDNMIYKWRKSKWDLLCLTGNLVYWMTYYIQKLTFQMYKFVQKEYLKLSRNMEYNADTIAANSIGKKAFISSLYKVEIISVIDDFYNNILRHMISKNEIVANYETGYKIVEQRIKEYENYDFSEKKFITEDYKHECPSKIKLEQIWSTHPSLDDRVINIERAKGCKTNELDKRPSLLLVNENIRQKIYADKLNSIIEESDAAPATIDNNTFDKFKIGRAHV